MLGRTAFGRNLGLMSAETVYYFVAFSTGAEAETEVRSISKILQQLLLQLRILYQVQIDGNVQQSKQQIWSVSCTAAFTPIRHDSTIYRPTVGRWRLFNPFSGMCITNAEKMKDRQISAPRETNGKLTEKLANRKRKSLNLTKSLHSDSDRFRPI